MKNLINIQNGGNLSSEGYPLFLGEDLGFADTVNVTYKELADLYEEHRGQFWIETEHSLSQDKIDFEEDPVSGDIMIRNLLSQWLMDSVAARSIMTILEPFASNNELIEILSVWQFFEQIHARTYSYIIRECFPDGNAVLERAKADIHVAYRSKIIGKVFNDTAQMAAKYTAGEELDVKMVKLQILKTIFAVYGLESISFMASFACTFAITERGKFPGCCSEITQICRDEVLHAKFGKAILHILLNKEAGYKEILEEYKDEFREILVEACRQEFSFAEYIFSDGRSTIGCNTKLLKEYTQFLAAPAFDMFGMDYPDFFGEIPNKIPLPYMTKFLEPDSIQSAAQELTLTNYRVGMTVDDTNGKVFETKWKPNLEGL